MTIVAEEGDVVHDSTRMRRSEGEVVVDEKGANSNAEVEGALRIALLDPLT